MSEQSEELEAKIMDSETKMTVPDTVGEMIEFLQKFPKERKLDIYYVECNDCGSEYETPAYFMNYNELPYYGSVEITFK